MVVLTLWPHRLMVRTLASQASNRGSTPRGAARKGVIM